MKPIILLSMPRSGSSMVAGLFANHGLWTGTLEKPNHLNPKGFFENVLIKRFLIQKYGHIVRKEVNPSYYSGFENDIKNLLKKDGLKGEQWMYKVSALYYEPFKIGFPEAKFIVVRRNLDSMRKSQEKTGMRISELSLQKHLNIMSKVSNKENVVIYDDIINGNFEGLKKAIEYCGLVYGQSIVDNFVDVKHKHF